MDLSASTHTPGFHDLPHGVQSALFSLLSPRTLALCACVCRSWHALVTEQAWQEAHAALWPLPPPPLAAATEPPHSWQLSYALRQSAARCWLGRPSTDKLIAHRTAVKACCLLPGCDVLVTGEGRPAAARLLSFPQLPANGGCCCCASGVCVLQPLCRKVIATGAVLQAAWTELCGLGTCRAACS